MDNALLHLYNDCAKDFLYKCFRDLDNQIFQQH